MPFKHRLQPQLMDHTLVYPRRLCRTQTTYVYNDILERFTSMIHISKEIATHSATNDTQNQTWGPVATVLRQDEQLSEAALIYTDEIDSDKKDMFAPFLEPLKSTDEISDEEFLAKIKIEGTEQLKARIKTLCLKNKGIFSDKLKAKPANIPPFELTIDKRKWETFRNRGPVRVQTQPKQVELYEQVQDMLANGIIEKSQATYYSQVMLTPKPDGSYHFCADYRNMNGLRNTRYELAYTQHRTTPPTNRSTSLRHIRSTGPDMGIPSGSTASCNQGTHRIHDVRRSITIYMTSVRTKKSAFILPGANGFCDACRTHLLHT
jgi:hypothetical protein